MTKRKKRGAQLLYHLNPEVQQNEYAAFSKLNRTNLRGSNDGWISNMLRERASSELQAHIEELGGRLKRRDKTIHELKRQLAAQKKQLAAQNSEIKRLKTSHDAQQQDSVSGDAYCKVMEMVIGLQDQGKRKDAFITHCIQKEQDSQNVIAMLEERVSLFEDILVKLAK